MFCIEYNSREVQRTVEANMGVNSAGGTAARADQYICDEGSRKRNPS